MLIPARIRSLWRNLVHRKRADQELNEELRSYLDELVEKNISGGMGREEAQRKARISLGGVEQVKEQVRDARAGAWLASLARELRIGMRQLRRDLGFAVATVLTLAFGLAAVVTIFALVETVVLRPLDFPRSERIFMISQNLAPIVNGPTVVSAGEFEHWQKSGLFEYAAAIDTAEYTLLGRGRARRIFGLSVTPDFFHIFEVRPFLGRGFVAQDGTPGHDNVIVLSYALWKSAFGADPRIIGKAVRMSDGMVTVIGVMPPRFDFPRLADVRTIMYWAPEVTEFWSPLTVTQKMIEDRDSYSYLVVGRLGDNVTPAHAAAQFKASTIPRLREVVAKEPGNPLKQILATFVVYVRPLQETMSQSVRGALWILLAAVGLLLLLVLFNLGNLLLTRSARRAREFVVREALGATRWQLFWQGFVEQILLITAAAGVSLVLAEWGVATICAVGAGHLPRLYDLSIDLRVMALLLILSLVVAVVFGALPLLVLRNSALTSVLQSEGRNATADRRTNRLKSGLMVLEIAVSMILLVGAGLLIQSFANVMRVNPGFDPHKLLTINVSLNPKTNQNAKQRLAHVRELLSAFRGIPGVSSAAVVNVAPLTGETEIQVVKPMGRTASPTVEVEPAQHLVADPSYFSTMRIPVLAGRTFREDESGKVAVINHRMALSFWPRENAVGKQFRHMGHPPLTVIGVVGGVHNSSLEQPPDMQFYVPLASQPYPADQFMIRTRINPEAILPLAQQAVWRLDPEAPVSHAQNMEHLLRSITLDRRFETGLISGFAAAALFLSMLGLFSMASLSVAARRREFGVRLALGARGADLVKLELLRTLRVAWVGVACGLAGSFVLDRVVSGFLYGVTAWSPTVYGLTIVVLIVPAFLAAWLPARRAARVDPASALRYE